MGFLTGGEWRGDGKMEKGVFKLRDGLRKGMERGKREKGGRGR